MRVLVVDDHADNAGSMCAAVAVMGHECKVASSVQAGAALAESWTHDAMIIDYNLSGHGGPKDTGADLLRRLRVMGDGTPCAMVTAHDKDIIAAIETRIADLGPVIVRQKPLDMAELIAELEMMHGA